MTDPRLRAAQQAVSDACRVCRHVQGEIAELRAELKDDRSPVTVADWASQAVVVMRLRELLGDEVVIGEEDASALRDDRASGLREHVLESVRLVRPDAGLDEVLDAIGWAGPTSDEAGSRAFWTLDPIDGTKGFLRGEQYAVSLGWIEDGQPRVGALGCPNLSPDFARPFDDPDAHGLIFSAVHDTGVVEVPADRPEADPVPLRRLERIDGDAARICQSVEKAHTNRSSTQQVLDHLGIETTPARLDSQAKYAVVARRQADAYMRMPSSPGYIERIWDHAAGSLVAQEAGATVTDIRGRRLDFGQGRGLEKNLGVVCAAPALHGPLIGAIAELGLDEPAGESK